MQQGAKVFPSPVCQGLQHCITSDLSKKFPLAEPKQDRQKKETDAVECLRMGKRERLGPQGKRIGSDVDFTE